MVERWPERPPVAFADKSYYLELGIKFWKYLDLYLSIDYLKTHDVFQALSDSDKVSQLEL